MDVIFVLYIYSQMLFFKKKLQREQNQNIIAKY